MNESSAAFRLEDIVTQLEEDIVFGVFHPKEKLTEPQIGTA
jgi:DNA-binding GntR family transcriptional regulator